MTITAAKKIPFFNYKALYQQDEQKILAAIQDVCQRGAYILQKDLEQFEASMRSFLNARYVWGVADGTNALIIGLYAMGIGAGDEVIVPSHTYVASAASIHLVGATPVLADCGPDHLVDPNSIRKLITRKTKAIMPVHVNGRTCAMDPILELARQHGLQIIEDAAQALGSKYKGKNAGTFGSVGTISLYPAKVLGCFGDGGLVISNYPQIGEKLGTLRDHGRDAKGDVVCWGTNSRLDNLQAAILSVKFKSFEQAIARRREIARAYHQALHTISDLTLPPPPEEDLHFDIYQNYELESGKRDQLRAYLLENGISTIIQWAGKPIHHLTALGLATDNLPNTDQFFKRCFMLPMNTTLSNDDVQYICSVIKQFYGCN